MATIAGLNVSLALDSATFIRETRRVSAATERMSRDIVRSNAAITAASSAVRGAITGMLSGLSVGLLAAATKQALDLAGGLEEISQTAGVTAKELQALTLAGTQAGVSQEQLVTALGLFGRNVGLASRETTTFGKTLARNNIEIRDGSGAIRASSDVLRDFADVVQSAGSEQEKLALLQEAFGRSGRAMINVFGQGAEGIDKFIEKAERLGLILSDDMIAKADAASDAIATLKLAVQTGFQAGIIETFADGVVSSEEALIRARKAGEDFGKFVGAAFQSLIPLMQGVGTAIESIRNLFRANDLNFFTRKLTELREEHARLQQELSNTEVGVTGQEELEQLMLRLQENRNEQAHYQDQLDQTLAAQRGFNEGVAAAGPVMAGTITKTAELAAKTRELSAESFAASRNFAQVLEERKRAERSAAEEAKRLAEQRVESIDNLRVEADQQRRLAAAHKESAASVREVELAIAAENEIRNLKLDAGSKEAALIRKLVAEEGAHADAIERTAFARKKQIAAADEAVKIAREVQERSAQARQDEEEKAARRSVAIWENAVDDIQSTFTNVFDEMLQGELTSFEDFANSVHGVFTRLAANLATLALFDPKQLEEFLGALSQGQKTLLAGGLGAAGGGLVGSFFGGRGQLGGSIGGGIGAAGGFALGSTVGLGPVGGIAGGLLGSLLGGVLGGRFGNEEDTGALRFATGRGSPFDVGRFGSLNISGENSFAGPLRDIVARFDQGVSEFLTSRQEQMAEQAVQALEQFEGRFPEADPSAGFLAILKERGAAILEAILPETADIEKIFEGVADIDQLGQRVQVALQAIQTFNELTGKTLTPAQQLEEAVVGVRQQFADLVPILRTLGYSEEELASARQEAINQTKQAAAAEQQAIALEKQALTLQLQGFIAGNSLQQTLVGIRIQFLQLRQSAIGLGVSLDLVDQAFHAAIAGARAADKANRDAAARARADRIAAAAQQRADNARRRRDEAERRAEERRQRTLDRAGFINQLSVAGRADLSPAEQFAFGLRDINLKYIEAAHRARELGVSLRLVRAARQREIDTLRATTNALKASEKAARELAVAERHVARMRFAIDLRRFLPTTPAQELQLQLRELNLQINEFRKQARAMGFTVDQVNNIWRQAARNLREEFIAELQAGIADLADQAVGLRDRFQSLLDPLLEFQRELQGVGASPAQSFQLAQQDFSRIAQLALGGNIAAIEQIDEAGRALLDAAALFGASPLVADVQQQVADVVGRVIERTTDAQNDAMRGVTSAIERTGRDTVARLDQLVTQGRENAAAIARQDRLLQQVVANTGSGRRTA